MEGAASAGAGQRERARKGGKELSKASKAQELFEVNIDVLALLAVRATRSYLATGRNERRGASFACAYYRYIARL